MSETGLISDQVVIGTANGVGLWMAEPGSTIPTAITADFAAPWVPLGYASTDGPTLSTSIDSNDINAWQALGAIRTIVTGRTLTMQFQLLQFNPFNLAVYFDLNDFTATDGVFSVDIRTDQAGRRRMLGVDVKDGDNQLRFIFPRATLSDAGDLQFQRTDAAVLDVTFTALETGGSMGTIQGNVGGAALLRGQPLPPAGGGGGGSSRSTVEAA